MAAGTAKVDVKELEKEIEQLKEQVRNLEDVNEGQAKSLRESYQKGPGDALVIAPLKRTNRFVSRRIDINLPRLEAQALRDLFDGLYETEAKLKSGKLVENHRQALLWLLEKLAETPVPERAINSVLKNDLQHGYPNFRIRKFG